MTSAMADSDADELNERIQNLPQELQDHILEYTIAIEPGVVTIDETYKPPWQLQINRATRKIVAKQFYTTTVFNLQFPEYGTALACLEEIARSLLCLPEDHQRLISHFQHVFSTGYLGRSKPFPQERASQVANSVYTRLTERLGLHLEREAFKFSLGYVANEGEEPTMTTAGCTPTAEDSGVVQV